MKQEQAQHPPGSHAWNREARTSARTRKRRNFLFLVLALASHVWTRLRSFVPIEQFHPLLFTLNGAGPVNSMWITGTITPKAKSEAKSFSLLRGLQVDFSPLRGLSQSPTRGSKHWNWPANRVGPGNFASHYGRLMIGVSFPDMRERSLNLSRAPVPLKNDARTTPENSLIKR